MKVLSREKKFSKRTANGFVPIGLTILIIFLSTIVAYGQQKQITGTVTDDTGEGLPGATVQVKGTTDGTITSFDGSFSLQVSENDVLVISSVGYQKVEIPVGARTTFDITMEVDVEELSEVVVIGYGQVEKGDVTGVVNKVDAKNFNKGMLTNPEQLIAGKVAGVQVTQNSGEPGGGLTVRIRGGSTLGGGNDPLYVVDGIPLEKGAGVAGNRSPLSFINPADIADITVLKDASAAAIYGSRGASGVVIITTKSGQSGKPQFTYDGSVSVSSLVDRVEMLTTEEFVFTVERQAPQYIDDLGAEGELSNTDWLDQVIETAVGQNHNLGSSFGIGDHSTARVSVNYQNLDGILKSSNTERIAGNINWKTNLLNDDLTLTWTSKHALINNRFAPNVVGSALIYAPTQPVKLSDGSFFQWDNNLAPQNPLGTIKNTFNLGRTTRNLIGVSAKYDIPVIEGLSVEFNYAYDKSDGLSQVTNRQLDIDGNIGGFSYFENENESNLFESYLNYSLETSLGKLDLTGGYSYQDFENQILTSLGMSDTVVVGDLNINNPRDFISDSKLDEIRPFLVDNRVLARPQENRLISFWGRANFSIRDKYLITTTLRRDGSTRFGESNRWGLFPSAAVGWRVIDEPFMEEFQNIFSNLKFRVSWGVTGNQDIGNYLYVPVYEPGGVRAQYIHGQDSIATVRPNAVDPDIKWEETESLNLGLDYGFFGGRLTGSIDYYEKTTSDLLLNITFPIGVLPGDQAVTNVAEFESKGFEFLLNAIAVDRPDLRVDLTVNGSYNDNTILKLNRSNDPNAFGIQTGGISGDVGQSIQVLRVNNPNPAFLVYEHKRDENGNPIPDGEDVNGDGLRNDLDMYEDQNGDGIINEDDLTTYKSPLPKWIFGFTGNVRYKKFDLAMTWRASLGNYTYNNVFSQFGTFQGISDPFSPNNIHVSAYENDFSERQLLSDIYVEDASFLKLDNITLGYNFGDVGGVQTRAYFTASNVLIISGYSGIDPEAGGPSGIDNNLYPRNRTFVLGLNLTLK